MGFPGGSDSKDFACNAGDLGLIPGLGRPTGEGSGAHASILPGESHRQRSLVGYSPCSYKELDTAECLTPSLSFRDEKSLGVLCP